jgi:hypothetical protein
MEIKFFDRIKACERLMNQTEAKADEGMSFYQALEKSAKEISGGLND